MQDCEGRLHPRAHEGILLFNRGRYFEAHEELEWAWREERGGIRQLYQGILEAGVTYLHLRRRNLDGATKVFHRSMRWLRSWPVLCRGVNVGLLRSDLEHIITAAVDLGQDRLSELDPSLFRPIEWHAISIE